MPPKRRTRRRRQRRYAPDGELYTFQEFRDYYGAGAPVMWQNAPLENAPMPPLLDTPFGAGDAAAVAAATWADLGVQPPTQSQLRNNLFLFQEEPTGVEDFVEDLGLLGREVGVPENLDLFAPQRGVSPAAPPPAPTPFGGPATTPEQDERLFTQLAQNTNLAQNNPFLPPRQPRRVFLPPRQRKQKRSRSDTDSSSQKKKKSRKKGGKSKRKTKKAHKKF